MLLDWIAEVADEPLVLNSEDRREEWDTNTWMLGGTDEEERGAAAGEVAGAFRRVAEVIRGRVAATGWCGAASFYVWFDAQAWQLRCSLGSVGPDALPFFGPHVPTGDLVAIAEAYLAGPREDDGSSGAEREPLAVWVAAVGAGGGEGVLARAWLVGGDGTEGLAASGD